MKTAHLVLHIDTLAKPPVVTWAGIFSEGWASLTVNHARGHAYADVISCSGATYEEARDDLDKWIEERAQWVLPLLDPGRD